jgi:penicillin-binding protein 1A
MAHAYNTLEEDGDRITGTLGSSKKGPVGIAEVREDDDNPTTMNGEPVEDKDGNPGINESKREQMIAPETAETATTVLASVVTSGTGKQAQTGEPTWGKTGTTDNNGDAWFCGAIADITACVWVGHADSNEPMLTEYGGNPVDGGTYPAIIFARVVNAYLATVGAEEPTDDEDVVMPPTETTTPAAPVEPEATAPAEEAPAEEAAPAPEAPADGGGAAGAVGAGRKN